MWGDLFYDCTGKNKKTISMNESFTENNHFYCWIILSRFYLNFTTNFCMEWSMNANWPITFVAMRNCPTMCMAKFVDQVFNLLAKISIEFFGSNSWQFIVRHFKYVSGMSWCHYTKQASFKKIVSTVKSDLLVQDTDYVRPFGTAIIPDGCGTPRNPFNGSLYLTI